MCFQRFRSLLNELESLGVSLLEIFAKVAQQAFLIRNLARHNRTGKLHAAVVVKGKQLFPSRLHGRGQHWRRQHGVRLPAVIKKAHTHAAFA